VSVGLYLMNRKGLAVLEAALDTDAKIAHVVTANADGMNDDSHRKIEKLAKANEVPVFYHAVPPSYKADMTIAAGWRWMLDTPNLVVLHDSLLPRYRGFAPLITALVNGEPEIGVTAFLAADEPDTGPIIGQRRLPIRYPARAAETIGRLVPLYFDLARELCEADAAGEPIRTSEQDHAQATYSLWRDEDDYRIDWSRDDRRIVRLVDAVSDPFPGATTTLAGNPVRVLGATTFPDVRIEDRVPGKVYRLFHGNPVVVCGSGLVLVTHLIDMLGKSLLPLPKLKVRFA
jgi:methionyl-tRNA formyltransferase